MPYGTYITSKRLFPSVDMSFIPLMTLLAFTQSLWSDLWLGYWWKDKLLPLSLHHSCCSHWTKWGNWLLWTILQEAGWVGQKEKKMRKQATFKYMISNTIVNASWRHSSRSIPSSQLPYKQEAIRKPWSKKATLRENAYTRLLQPHHCWFPSLMLFSNKPDWAAWFS